MKSARKKVLVTGIAGMIGSHLLDALLEKKYSVIGLDNFSYGKEENILHHFNNPDFKFELGDVADAKVVMSLATEVDFIVHLAAVKKIGEKDASMPTLNVNAHGTENVLEAARKNNCKLIFASTSDVYGMSPDLPLNEAGDLLLGPSMVRRWSYAVSKLYGEQLSYAYFNDYKVPVVVLRYFGGFSPRSSFSWSGGHIPIFISAILNNEEVVIHGDGSQTRSMGFVTDLVDGTLLALENENAIGRIINIGNDEEMSVIDSAKLIHRIAATGRELNMKFVPMTAVFGQYKDIMRRIPDLTLAKQILGYAPKVKLEKAIALTIAEMKKKPVADGQQ
ncbi:MAG: GDP-mannose 4,6-dehydratase [Flavobacteriales bacterium]|nr:GDP-mannose 4,6-dehydratase [Flavobacteriales bacterium]